MNAKPKATSKAVVKPIKAVATKPPTTSTAKAALKSVPARTATKKAKSFSQTAAKVVQAQTVLPTAATPASSNSKQSQLIDSLRSPNGMTIEEMMILTGWQAHSVRGTISGALRKRMGLNVVASPTANGQSRCYRIIDQAQA